MDKYTEILKEYWGYDAFRGIQRDIIESIGAGHDTLGLMPTGGGKSLTFQVPALATEGLCLVITPLIALMKDQVMHLRHKGIKASAIYTGMSSEKIITTLENCIFGDYKFLYISPERIASSLFQNKLARMHVSFICIDEAHCICQWGYDFRPSYLQVKELRKLLPHAPILALTATATPEVVADIQVQLGFREERVFRMSFERKNLAYKVQKVELKDTVIKRILKEREGSTILYCRNRQLCKEWAEKLQEWGYTATYYHAGLDNKEKDERQERWQHDKVRIMVATNAFGMGIDKPDVRLVLHISAPDSIEAYFQEAGRAGRDGQYAEAIMVYNGNDIATLHKHVGEYFPEKEFIREVYEEVCCFLQIAMGFGQGVTREFNLMRYCTTFRKYPTYVESALNLLTKAGYIQYMDADEGVSRLFFQVRRDDLYHIHEEDKANEALIQSLLRHYSGLFVKHMPIDESLLAQSTGMSTREVYQHLVKLSQQGILHYIPKKKIPRIAFTRERVDKRDIRLDKDIYDMRKKVLKERIDCMLEYLTEDDTCRSQYLLRYFGEKKVSACGHCDVCRENQAVESPLKGLVHYIAENVLGIEPKESREKVEAKTRIHEAIVQQVEKAQAIHPFYLELEEYDTELCKEVLKEMIDQEEIEMDEFLRIKLTEKYLRTQARTTTTQASHN